MENQQPQNKETSTRKKFVIWGLSILGSLSILKYVNRKPAEPKKDTVKMLTQDGTLVEVDRSKIFNGKRKKVTDEELKKWVSKS